MKKENTSTRLKKIMPERNLRQVDILNSTRPYCEKYGVKMNKSDISQYCSGKTEPNQDKLFVLGMALNVSEAWLMGYDVPMERLDSQKKTEDPASFSKNAKENNDLTRRDERDIKKDLDSLVEKLSSKQYGPAAYDGEEIPEEDIELFAGQLELMLRRLKKINKVKYNPNKNKK